MIVIEHADGRRLTHRIRKPVQQRLRQTRKSRRMQIGLAEPQHHRRQRKQLVLVPHITQMRERDQVAARRRPCQAGALGHFGDAQPAALLVEGLDHLQALFEAGDHVTLGWHVVFGVHDIEKFEFGRYTHKLCA